MTKDDIKLLCESDEKLEWWAMVLFAEIAAMIESYPKPDDAIYTLIVAKVREFDRLVIQRSLELAKEKISNLTKDEGDPRHIWFNEYASGLSEDYYLSKEVAVSVSAPDIVRQVEFIEVVEK